MSCFPAVLCNTHQESESQDIPEPPSPSTIPCRQDLEMVTTSTLPYSPLPISPVNTPFNTTQVQVMEGTETLQSSVSESRKTPDGLGTRPKRMAPPPPVGKKVMWCDLQQLFTVIKVWRNRVAEHCAHFINV